MSRTNKLLFVAAVLAGVLLSQTQFGVRSLRGPSIWFRDGGSGNDILVDLDPKTLVLDPPGTSGGRPILRAITPSGAAIREKSIIVSYPGAPIILPDTPLAGTVLKMNWGALPQIAGQNFTLNGNIVTLNGNGWVVGDTLVFTYFY